MSWWDSAGLGNLVSQGLKHAQQKIDKVLDIQESARAAAAAKSGAAASSSSYQPTTLPGSSSRSRTTSEDDTFFQSWGIQGEGVQEQTSVSVYTRTPVSPSTKDVTPKHDEEASNSGAFGFGLNFGYEKSAFTVVSKTIAATSESTLLQEDSVIREEKESMNMERKLPVKSVEYHDEEDSVSENKLHCESPGGRTEETTTKVETSVSEPEANIVQNKDTTQNKAQEESGWTEFPADFQTDGNTMGESHGDDEHASSSENSGNVLAPAPVKHVEGHVKKSTPLKLGSKIKKKEQEKMMESEEKTEFLEVEKERTEVEISKFLANVSDTSVHELEGEHGSVKCSSPGPALTVCQDIETSPPSEEEKELEKKSLSFEMTVTEEVSDGWEVSLDGDLTPDGILESETYDDKPEVDQQNESGQDMITSQPVGLQENTEDAESEICEEHDKHAETEADVSNATENVEPVIDVVSDQDQVVDGIDTIVEFPLSGDSTTTFNLAEVSDGPPGGADEDLDNEPGTATMILSASSAPSDMEMVESTEISSGQEESSGKSQTEELPVPQSSEEKNSAGDLTVSDEIVEETQNFVDKTEDPNVSVEPVDLTPASSDMPMTDDNSSKLHVSFESSADELSESNRTLTGEDFQHTSRSETEESKDSASEHEDAPTVKNTEEVGEESKPSSAGGDESREGAGSSLSSSSYVKNMLEEAMVESVKDTESQSCSSSERSSDMVRIESGLNSGHTSGDEIDTTTSSDIEIISTPTPNGEYRAERPFDLSPLRHALSRGIRRSPPGHKRSDSGSSGQSTWSKNGDDIPGLEGHRQDSPHEMQTDGATKTRELAKPGSREKENHNNPLETEKLLKATNGENNHLTTILESSEVQHQDSHVWEKLADMAEVLEAREKKLVDMSRENMDLQEANSILRHQLQQMEEAREAEMTDVNTLTSEFAVRIGEAEKKLQAVLREKEALRKQLQRAEAEIMKKSDNSAFELLLQEKEQQVSELLEEGEKLSKQQLQTNNIVKKLRTKEKENETVLKTQKQKLEEQKKELEHLRKVCDAKEELEKKQTEAIHQLNGVVKKQEMEMNRGRSDLEDAHEKHRSMQVALDNSYKEIAELHKAKAARASEAQEAALSAEMTAKQELQLQLERYMQQARHEQEALITQIEDLHLSIGRLEKEHHRREDILRQEISDVQQRLQEAEGRNQELTQAVTAATRPLLRQIENLQSTYTAQNISFEKVEKNLTERLVEAQTQLAGAVEKERAASEAQLDTSARLATLESQVSVLRQERSKLSAQLEMERTKVEVLEDAKNNDAAQLEALKGCYDRELADVKKEKVMVDHQLEIEKMKLEAEKKKLLLAHEQLRDKDMQLQSRGSVSPALSRDGSINSEMSTSFTTISQEEVLEKTLMISSSNGSLRSQSLYENLRQSGAANLLENMQSQLKQKEGEIQQLQSEIHELERTRESMARELVNLTNRLEELEEMAQSIPEYQRQHKELDTRYQALLQMYGEKVEETEELRLDLLDVKEMYKGQIEELLKV